MKAIKDKICAYFYFRYSFFVVVSVVLCALSIVFSYYFKGNDPFISGIFGNVFAGLLTGLIIAIYSNLKNSQLSLILNFVNDVNNINDSIYKFIKRFENIECNNCILEVKEMYNEYVNLQSILFELNDRYKDFGFKIHPQPALGDPDECVKEMEKRISYNINMVFDNEFSKELIDGLSFMIDSAYIMCRQNQYVINYIMKMYIDITNKVLL